MRALIHQTAQVELPLLGDARFGYAFPTLFQDYFCDA
jgi:hypothetical protein